MKSKARFFFVGLWACILFMGMFLYWLCSPIAGSNINGQAVYKYVIAHAGGAIEGHTYTNSREALMNAIERKCQYAEVDLYLTKDSQLVCIHNLSQYCGFIGRPVMNEISLQEFQGSMIFGKYHPLTFNEALQIRKQSNIVLVTDKISNVDVLNKFVYDKKERNKIMVEAFSITDYFKLQEYGYIPMLSIFHGYIGRLKSYFMCLFYDIDWIVISKDIPLWYFRSLKRLTGVKMAVYTVNEMNEAQRLLGKEADLIYTDSLIP